MTDWRMRILVLTVLMGIAGVMLIDAPVVPLPGDRVDGPRVFAFDAADVRGIDLTRSDGEVAVVRTGAEWLIDGRPAGLPLAGAVDGLVVTLAELRPVDRFEDGRDAPFGLREPHGRLVVRTSEGAVTLALGDFNVARSAVYGRIVGDPHVLILGAYLVSVLDRVFSAAHAQRSDGTDADHAPEIG